MRREISGMGILRAALFGAAFLFCFFAVEASAQERDTLLEISEFKRQSIIDYCEQYGDILSVSELSLVDGFTPDEAQWLWEDVKAMNLGEGSRPVHTITSKFKKKYAGEGFSLTGKYDFDSRRKLSAGLTVDNDPCEKFPDFLSGFVKYGRVIVGDYSARFGQGLVLWKAFGLSAMGEPASLVRRPAGLQPYRSTDESNFLRGAAGSFRVGRLAEISLFASYNAVDARLVDSCYTSIATDGLHATDAERAKRHSMHEVVFGSNCTLQGDNWRVGITAVGYSYNKHNGRRIQDYNRLQQYDGLWGNFGVDFMATLGAWRLFGEAALDAGASPAALLGAIWSPSYNLEVSFQAKAFSPSYIATHSCGTTHNLLGGVFVAKYIVKRWKFNLNAEYSYYPWYRFQKPAGGSLFKARLAAQYTFPRGAVILAQASWSQMPKGRLHVSVPLGRFTVAARAEGNPGGLATYLEFSYGRTKWSCSLRGTYYNTSDWDHRVYLCEKGVPQTFGTEAYYGKGAGGYLVVKYSPVRHIDLCLKAQQNYCAFFTRIVIPG